MYTFLSSVPSCYTRSYTGTPDRPTMLVKIGTSSTEVTGVARNKAADFYGVDEVIRQEMLRQNLYVAHVDLEFYEAHSLSGSTTLDVVFTDRVVTGMTADQFILARLVRTSDVALFAPGTLIGLTLPYVKSVVGTIYLHSTFVYEDAAGEQQSKTMQVELSDGEFTMALPTGVTETMLLSVSCKILKYVGGQYTVLGTFTFVPIHEADWVAFRFRNVFNAPEVICLPASVTRKPSTDYQTAKCLRSTEKYDLRHSLLHEVSFGVTYAELLDPLLQCCQSRSVEYLCDGEWRPINITEYEIPVSDALNDATKPSLKFEYCSADGYITVE